MPLCVGKDNEFRWRYQGFIDLGSFYGATYWKNRTYMEFANNRYKEQPNDGNRTLLFYYLDNVMAMDIALQEVCAQVNIDVLAVKKLALCDDEYSPGKCHKLELVKEYVGLFLGLVETA
jgi:hypothetical protein